MVGTSKSLTISCGGFCCTLEGYDDPSDTVRAIAEYLRGLAGDDIFIATGVGRQAPPARNGRGVLQSPPDAEGAVNRLLRQTNSELEGAEQRRRASTMSHLKAAVAATVADSDSTGAAEAKAAQARTDRYRADLARALHQRPANPPPFAERMPPMVLASEQRVDGSPPPPVPPTTRAQADVAAAAQRTEAAFAEFAARLGVTRMPDLIEAAAAYTLCIEGQPHFTRPQVMRHVADLPGRSTAPPEDGLRGFGQLLRQGRIARLRQGQFALAETSHLLAKARRLAH